MGGAGLGELEDQRVAVFVEFRVVVLRVDRLGGEVLAGLELLIVLDHPLLALQGIAHGLLLGLCCGWRLLEHPEILVRLIIVLWTRGGRHGG